MKNLVLLFCMIGWMPIASAQIVLLGDKASHANINDGDLPLQKMEEMMKIKLILIYALLGVVFSCQQKNQPLNKEAVFMAQKVDTELTIDGLADESSWQKAKAHSFDYFYHTEQPNDKQESSFKMLWNESYLYFLFECKDKFITAREKNRDGQPYFDDCAEVFLIPTADKINMHFGFEVNLYKASNDFVYINNIHKEGDFVVKGYSPDFEVAVTVDETINDNSDVDKGWAIEMAIPINAFHTTEPITPIEAGTKWALMAIRQDRNDADGNRRSTSTIFPLAPENEKVHNPKGFGVMEFVEE